MHRGADSGNYGLIAQQFLRALRGRRSQRALARRLGYAANPITDWEHGRRVPRTSEVLRAAGLLGIDVVSAFSRFHQAGLPSKLGGYDLASWMDSIRGSARVRDIAQRAGLSRFALGRWLRGESEPRLHDFMCYVDAATGRLYDWVAELVPIVGVPALRARYENAVALRRAAQDALWIEPALRALETARYRATERHRDGVVAKILQIPLKEEKKALRVLRKARAIRLRRGLYEPVEGAAVDMRGDAGRVTRLLRQWSDVAVQRAERKGRGDVFAYSISSLSNADASKAQEILRRAFREIRSLVRDSQPTERVMLVNLQLVFLDSEDGD